MSDSPNVIDVSREDFEQLVLAASNERPVLVDFWADWCAPCKTLMPLLEKLAEEYAGQFLLARINTEQQQELATAFQIKSLPTVKLLINNEVVDEFMGAISETEVRQFLDKHITHDSIDESTESDSTLNIVVEHLAAGRTEQAIATLESAFQSDPSNAMYSSQLATLYAQNNQVDKAEAIYNDLDSELKDSSEGLQLDALIKLAKERENIIGADEAIELLKKNPEDPEALYSYSLALIFKKHFIDGMENLLNLMSIDRQYKEGAAQKALIEVFKIIGEQHESVTPFRKKMARLLY